MKIKAMYKIIGELESLGDSGESIARILSRRNSHNKSFDAETIAKLMKVVGAVDQAYIVMIANLEAAHVGALSQIQNAYDAEEEINTLRNDLREAEIEEIESNTKNYQTSVYYMDIVSKLEGMGDFIINVSQSLERAFVEK
jgi:phosphate:Na+ symporter